MLTTWKGHQIIFYKAYAGEIEARNIQKRLGDWKDKQGSPNMTRDNFRKKNITVQFLKTPTGKVLGFVADGKIYLNPQAATPTTVWHELVHIQQQVIRVAATKGNAVAKAILSR